MAFIRSCRLARRTSETSDEGLVTASSCFQVAALPACSFRMWIAHIAGASMGPDPQNATCMRLESYRVTLPARRGCVCKQGERHAARGFCLTMSCLHTRMHTLMLALVHLRATRSSAMPASCTMCVYNSDISGLGLAQPRSLHEAARSG